MRRFPLRGIVSRETADDGNHLSDSAFEQRIDALKVLDSSHHIKLPNAPPPSSKRELNPQASSVATMPIAC